MRGQYSVAAAEREAAAAASAPGEARQPRATERSAAEASGLCAV